MTAADTPDVGGKNSALGEMIAQLASAQVRIPGGFATTARAYRRLLGVDGLEPRIRRGLDDEAAGRATLAQTGARIRAAFLNTAIPETDHGAARLTPPS